MNSATMATNLVGRPVRLRRRIEGGGVETGSITTVFIDQQGLHLLVEVAGELVQAELDQVQLVSDERP